MSKRACIFFLFIFCFNQCKCQLYGAQWMLGPNTTRIDFRNDTVVNDSIGIWMATNLTDATISDSAGNLLFYTNGIYVANSTGDSILNGNGLSPCAETSQYGASGLPIQQAAIFLPKPGDDRYIYLFHFSGDSNSNPATLYYSIIDRKGNSGLGEIMQKNVEYYGHTIFWAGGMTACKHANGRDWWIIMHGKNNNRFFKFLFTPAGITDTLIQDIGATYDGPYDNASACFSPDGSKYACGAFAGLITVLDFDRCTGEFSNPVLIDNLDGQTESGEGSLAFSPNSRFLYVSDRIDLTQYDLWNNIHDSVEVYQADSTDNAQINFVALAINGKIYGSTWNGGFEFLHVINYPDSLGSSCGFVRAGQPTLSVNSTNLPNMPNYMLGALSGSLCDSIPNGIGPTTETNPLRMLPNPADKCLYVEMGMQGNYEFELLNSLGQVIATRETKQVDNFDTERLSNGVYFLRVLDKTTLNKIGTKKVVVQH